ncbi:hypothetical protein N431DRAFT_559356 [Stipitochalara longipes BDJ]|nr:hypothetical protein N431DRAFT_559356 [Stipitochalara longipes BDJ]
MESPILPLQGIAKDMNDNVNMALYTQIMVFKMNPMEVDTLFWSPDPSQQRAIQTWAHAFGFNYEYSIANRTARVVKDVVAAPASTSELGEFEFFDFHLFPHMGVAENDFDITNAELGSFNVRQAGQQRLLDDYNLWLDSQDPLETEGNYMQTDYPDALPKPAVAEHLAPDGSQSLLNAPTQSGREEYTSSIPPSDPNAGRSRKSSKSRFGRRQSVHSPASSGYQEIIFDSGSSRPSSPATPGRRGPLDAAARAAMRAVKAMRACWRCKFLRKTCSPNNPCLRCPPPSTTNYKEKSWPTVGCNRGSFKEVLTPLYLCPRQDFKDTSLSKTPETAVRPLEEQESVNKAYGNNLLTRKDALRQALETSIQSEPTTLVSYLRTLDSETDRNIFKEYQASYLLPVPPAISVSFTPLEECITAVVYEANHCHALEVHRLGNFPQIVSLLYSAAKYQAKIETDRLIAQSIICLRSSFEAVRLASERLYDSDSKLTKNSHRLCETDVCQIDCIRTLEEHLGFYLKELSDVFFKKENMRIKETWWLSTFYSFAIQGLIRRLVQRLSYTSSSKLSTDQYLRLVVRLFIASSGDYDPLTRDYASLGKGKDAKPLYISDLQEAKNAVDQISWSSRGILSSADYLKNLFEDDGGDITINGMAPTRHATQESLESFPERLSTSFPYASPTQKEMSSRAWSSFNPAPFGSRPYRPSSLSSMSSASDIEFHPNSSALVSEPAFISGSSFGPAKKLTSQDPYHIPVYDHKTSRLPVAKKRVAALRSATRAFTERKEKKIKSLEQEIMDTVRLLKDRQSEREFYRWCLHPERQSSI